MVDAIYKYVTLIVTFETGEIEYYTLSPLDASIVMQQLTYIEEYPRVIKAKIIWGSTLDNFNY